MVPHLKVNTRIVSSLRKVKPAAGIASPGGRHCLRRARFALGHPLPSASHDIEWCLERHNRFATPDSPSHPRPPRNPTPPLTPRCCSGVARMVSPPLGWHGKLKNRGNHSPTPSLPSCVCPVLKIGWREGNPPWERGAWLIHHPFTPSTLRTLTFALALQALAAWTLGKRRNPLSPHLHLLPLA